MQYAVQVAVTRVIAKKKAGTWVRLWVYIELFLERAVNIAVQVRNLAKHC